MTSRDLEWRNYTHKEKLILDCAKIIRRMMLCADDLP
jgi:hypothetical protein